LVLDLDNTLWGGVIGDDGLEGIELGTTSPRGEAFRAFQHFVLSLKKRGILLGVCSKNNLEIAQQPFLKHPEMILKLEDITSFKASWQPKSDSIQLMAKELNLGLDSFVFVDDNPAEIEIVRRFLPQVNSICLDPDPAMFVTQLKNSRLFEPRNITSEDLSRSESYSQEARREELRSASTDYAGYLESLQMEAQISHFTQIDAPRISQLINKSNQFNLTTRRRSENEVTALVNDSNHIAFTVRLKDRFGDHGLISVLIAKIEKEMAVIDTWLMSCRVLKRQVEEEVHNELMRLAKIRGCTEVVGSYKPTSKNGLVKDLLPDLGFLQQMGDELHKSTTLRFSPHATKIRITSRAYD